MRAFPSVQPFKLISRSTKSIPENDFRIIDYTIKPYDFGIKSGDTVCNTVTHRKRRNPLTCKGLRRSVTLARAGGRRNPLKRKRLRW